MTDDLSTIVVSTDRLSTDQLAAVALALEDQTGTPVPPDMAGVRAFWRSVATALRDELERRRGLPNEVS